MSSPSMDFLMNTGWESEFSLKKEAATHPGNQALANTDVTNNATMNVAKAVKPPPVATGPRGSQVKIKMPDNVASGNVPSVDQKKIKVPGQDKVVAPPGTVAPPGQQQVAKSKIKVKKPGQQSYAKPDKSFNIKAAPKQIQNALTKATQNLPKGDPNSAAAQALLGFAKGNKDNFNLEQIQSFAREGIDGGQLKIIAPDPNANQGGGEQVARGGGPAGPQQGSPPQQAALPQPRPNPLLAGRGGPQAGAPQNARNMGTPPMGGGPGMVRTASIHPKGKDLDQVGKAKLTAALLAAAKLGQQSLKKKTAKATFAPAMDNSPLLKGKQSKLPDNIQAAILKKKAKQKTASPRWSSRFGHAPLIDWAQMHFEKKAENQNWQAPAPLPPPPAAVPDVQTQGTTGSGGGGGVKVTKRATDKPLRVAMAPKKGRTSGVVTGAPSTRPFQNYTSTGSAVG